MTRIVTQLEERGYVERHPNPDSKRTVSLRPSASALAALVEMDQEVNKINATITKVLDEERIAMVDTWLRECALLVEAEIEDLT